MAEDVSTASLYGELKGRVLGLENSVRDLRNDIEKQFAALSKNVEALNHSVLESSKPQWQVMTSFAGLIFVVVGALWVVVIQPLRTDIDRIIVRHDAFVDQVNAEFKTMISQSAVSDLKAEMKSKIEELNAKIEQLNKRGK